MEWNIFLITMGMLLSFGLIGIGVCIGNSMDKGTDKRELDGDSVHDVCMDERTRDRGSNHRCLTPEEINIVLYNLRIGASTHEKEVIDYLIDKETENEES